MCKRWLPLEAFCNSRCRKDRKHPVCKECENTRKRYARLLHKSAPPKPSHCECCGLKTTLSLDHDHDTGKFRGWLCEACNIGIGKLGDNLFGLKKAMRYLEITN
tara:strand:+ start:2548 stop:2859 length:312 start_codon:yes stop_codon:yes gene_type:complete